MQFFVNLVTNKQTILQLLMLGFIYPVLCWYFVYSKLKTLEKQHSKIIGLASLGAFLIIIPVPLLSLIAAYQINTSAAYNNLVYIVLLVFFTLIFLSMILAKPMIRAWYGESYYIDLFKKRDFSQEKLTYSRKKLLIFCAGLVFFGVVILFFMVFGVFLILPNHIYNEFSLLLNALFFCSFIALLLGGGIICWFVRCDKCGLPMLCSYRLLKEYNPPTSILITLPIQILFKGKFRCPYCQASYTLKKNL